MFEHDCLDTCCLGCLICMCFCICTCSAQLSMFHMERRSRNYYYYYYQQFHLRQTCWVPLEESFSGHKGAALILARKGGETVGTHAGERQRVIKQGVIDTVLLHQAWAVQLFCWERNQKSIQTLLKIRELTDNF